MKLTAYNTDNNIDRLFSADWEPFFHGTLADFFPAENVRPTYPRVNLVENEDGFTLTAEVPGWADENIDVEIKEGVLSVRGHVKEEKEKTQYYSLLPKF